MRLSLCIFLKVLFCFTLATDRQIYAQDVTFEKILQRAQNKSAQKFRRPKRIPSKDFDFGNPPNARGLVYLEALKIVPKKPVIENEGTGFSAYPRRGTAWEKLRIFYQKEKNGSFDEHKFDASLIRYDDPEIQPPLPKGIPKSVQHWTEVGIFCPIENGFPQIINMRANGYMRIASKGTIYGFSERGMIQQESLDNRPGTRKVRESFPLMTEVFFEYPTHKRTTVCQIFENATAVMARELKIEMGGDTIIKVTGKIFPRKGKKFTDKQNIGIGHISMYWKGQRDNAPKGQHAHDSDTVTMTFDDGSTETINIPKGLSKTEKQPFLFIDPQEKKANRTVVGYSLEQRDQDEKNYISEVGYHKRASMQIADMKWNIPTRTQLVVLPDDGEFFDNVVLRTVIRPNNPTSNPIEFSYRETIPQLK